MFEISIMAAMEGGFIVRRSAQSDRFLPDCLFAGDLAQCLEFARVKLSEAHTTRPDKPTVFDTRVVPL